MGPAPPAPDTPPVDPVHAVAEAMGTFDSLAAWYYDSREPRVVVIRDGRASERDLEADQVERDEERFIEIPAITRADEHDWLEDFQAAHGSEWPHIRLDMRKGSNERFLKSLGKSRPAVLANWEAFRLERLLDVASAWLDGLRPDA